MLPMPFFSGDANIIIKHLVSLDDDSKRMRFGGITSDQSIAKYVSNSFDQLNSVWYGYIDKGQCIGVVHIYIHNNECELGISISKEYRGKGLSNALFDRAIIYAKAQQVKTITMQCLSENAVMQHIAKKNGMQVVTLGPGEKGASINIDPGNTIVSSIADVNADFMSLVDTNIRNQFWLLDSIKQLSTFNFNKKEIYDLSN